jgi:hypothetical protein
VWYDGQNKKGNPMMDLDQLAGYFVQTLEEQVTLQYPKKKKTRQFWVSSSSVGGCTRRSFYDCYDPINDVQLDPPDCVAFFKGRLLHLLMEVNTKQIFRSKFKNVVKADAAEMFFKDTDKRLSGKIDHWLVTQDGESWVIDYKFKTSSSLSWFANHGPSETETGQLQAYMFAKDAQRGAIIAIDMNVLLDTGYVKFHVAEVPRGDEYVKGWLDIVENAWREGKPPEMVYNDLSKPPCSWCVYSGRCYPEEMEAKSQKESELEDIFETNNKESEVKKYGW